MAYTHTILKLDTNKGTAEVHPWSCSDNVPLKEWFTRLTRDGDYHLRHEHDGMWIQISRRKFDGNGGQFEDEGIFTLEFGEPAA